MIPIETLAGWGGTAVIVIGHIAVSQYKNNQNFTQLEKLWTWKDNHEKDVSEKRFELQKQIGALEGKVAIHDGNYLQILSILSEIKTEIKELRNKKEN